MLLGMIADVHSNLLALEAVLAELGRLGPERVLCAGDLVGYNAFPNEVIGLFREHRVESILGNHDRAVLTGITEDMSENAARAVEWTRERITEASRAYLEKLPRRLELSVGGRKLLVVHGSPRDDDEYVLPLPEDLWPFGDVGADVLIMAHTHVQWTARFDRPDILVMNPGSVGQPRDMDPRAAFATLDTGDMAVKLHRAEYDIAGTARSVVAGGLPPWLAQRLYLGR